jgi:Zn-dependent peptidase ImmA (M78 family)
VKSEISTIEEIENGSRLPTFKQIDTLANTYAVPRWVFIADEMPEQYRFEQAIPAFRQFSRTRAEVFDQAKLRRVVARVERYRNFMLDLIQDVGDSGVEPFTPPAISKTESPEDAAEALRRWLYPSTIPMEFYDWRAKLENKGVFVFVTSKYPGWSNIDDLDLRGLSIYHENLPVIVVNDSDSRKAQSFTLFHELGHVLRRESSLDEWGANLDPTAETWCDRFAGSFLMPEAAIDRAISQTVDFDLVKRAAGSFRVSSYAFLVRLRQLERIDQSDFEGMRDRLFGEYEEQRARIRSSAGGPARNRPKEVLTQFGPTFTSLVLEAYNEREIGLQKTSSILGLKRPSQALEVQALL